MNCYRWKKSDGSLSSTPSGDFASVASAGLVQVIDGTILGQPLPLIAGAGIPLTYFDPNYQDYEKCPPYDWLTSGYLHEYGIWTNYRVTQQTNKWEGSQLPFGRARLCGPQITGGIWVTKSVQTAVRYPTFNHAKPFGGKDGRWLVDERNVGCIQGDGSGGGTTLFDGTTCPLANTMNLTTGDHVLMFAVGGLSGIYPVATGAGSSTTSFTVGAKISGLPSGFTYWDTGNSLLDVTKGVCLKLRFPSCPPFGGRLAVQSVTDNHDGTCTIVTEATAVPIDDAVPSGQTFTVDLCGADMTALSSNKAVTTSNLTTFKVTETYATIATAKWVVLYGALEGETTVNWSTPEEDLAHASHPIPKWYWCYDGWQGAHDGVGNMVKGEWTKDFRTNGEHQRMNPGSIWVPSFDYALGEVNVDTGGNFWTVTTAGKSDPSTNPFADPSPTVGETVGDGTVVWTCSWVATCPGIYGGTMPTPNYGYDAAHTTLSDTCKGWVSCGPWLIVCSPHAGDTPPTGQGVRLDFASGYVAPIDERYGSAQYVDTFQGMLDPLYQTPHAACGGAGTTDVKPTCVPIVEARMILPGSTGSTVAPDGGGGASLTEVPPVLIDYTMLNPATHGSGNLALPPSPGSQPDSVSAPTGVYPPC